MIRRIVQFVFRLLAPVVRPIASRTRRYLVNGMREAIQQEFHRALGAAKEHDLVNGMREAIQQEFHRALGAAKEHGSLVSRLDRIERNSSRVAINCDAGEMLVKTKVGFLLCATSDHALLSCLIENGELEPGTRLLIQRFLRPGDVYVDVGANVGMHLLAAARAMRGQGRIIAFEPFEPTLRMLEKTVWMNGFSDMTEIHRAAVSNTAGHQTLFVGATSGHHSLFALDSSPQGARGQVDVPLVRLDGVIPSRQRIDLLKIDAEGAELDVIEGGASLIADNPDIALIVEFGPSHLRRTGHVPNQWFEAFHQLGLEFRVINEESGLLEVWSPEALERVESVNLLFSRADSKAWGRLS